MEREEVQVIYEEVKVMIGNLMCVNTENWMVATDNLLRVHEDRDTEGLLILHEALTIRLMAAMN